MNNHRYSIVLYIRTKINRFFIAALNDTYEFDVRNNTRVFLTSETFRKRWGLVYYRQFLCGIEANVGFCQRWTWRYFSFFWLKFFWMDSYFHRDPIIMIPHSPHRRFSHLVRISRYALKRCSLEIEIGLSRRYLN